MTMQNRGPRETAEQIVRTIAPEATILHIIADTSADYVNLLNDTAKQLGEKIKPTVTTSQIRGVFSLVREIEQDTLSAKNEDPLSATVTRRLSMLRPKLAYQVGRIDASYPDDPKKAQMGALVLILTSAVDVVLEQKTIQAFRNFVDFFEAILAYHKFFGGGDKARA